MPRAWISVPSIHIRCQGTPAFRLRSWSSFLAECQPPTRPGFPPRRYKRRTTSYRDISQLWLAMATGASGTLTPLPPVVRMGSIAISIFGLFSFFSALALLVYLTYNLIRWHMGRGSGRRQRKRTPGYIFTSGPVKFGPGHDAAKLAGPDPTVDAASLAPSERAAEGPRYPNQFIVLILNLLIADLHQATAFAISTTWVSANSIQVGTGACFTQGFFVSIGDLASSCFMSAIAVHTFYSIVYKYRPPHKLLYLYLVLIWAFVYLISILPVAGTLNGASAGGFFVRAGAWVSRNLAFYAMSPNVRLTWFTNSAGLMSHMAISVCLHITYLYSSP